MKKKILVAILLVMTLVVTGCDSKKEETKILTCSRNATITSGVKVELSYKATYKGDYVELIETEEKVISSDHEVLESYQETVESLYSPYKGVDYYQYSLEIDDDTFISKTRIDYSNIDTDKLIEIDSANATLIKDGKVQIEDVRAMYEALGATCK